jgi:hypothetical protein
MSIYHESMEFRFNYTTSSLAVDICSLRFFCFLRFRDMIIQDPTVMKVRDTVIRTKIQNCLEIANPEPSEVWKVKRFMPRKDCSRMLA